ncbi:neuralized-like protein 2 isoform X1 [Tyto alba]|uniref:neuralized-like protein 2 isoform X1 n=1 Tax=Tyto alba TaxID=56313 RepID=UPI001C66CCAE|nr:neuralized-like protein 2 isoform X1 [Tyto alba]
MAARCRLAARFHRVHGTNVRLDASRTRATRVESFANGLCFSQEPLAPGQIFLVEIEEKELGWCGHLRVGLTAHDPQSLEVVPEYSLPDLVNMGDTWVFAITRSHNRVAAEGEEAPARARGPPQEPFLLIERVRIPRDALVGRSRPGRYSHILDDLYKMNVLPATARRSRIGVLYTLCPDGTADMHIVINGEDMGPSARRLPAARPLYAVVDVFASTKSVRVIPVEYGCSSLPADPLPPGHPEAHRAPPGHRRPGPARAAEELLQTRVRCRGRCPAPPPGAAGGLPGQDRAPCCPPVWLRGRESRGSALGERSSVQRGAAGPE